VLAYVFWHRPRRDVDVREYEEAQVAFHEALSRASACIRLEELPFEPAGGSAEPDAAAPGGYEDWYLVDDWADLGQLNAEAVDAARRDRHDRAAALSAAGWGAVYALVKGPPAIPNGASWRHRPRDEAQEEHLGSLPETTVWQRLLVLGPAPELCLATAASSGRRRVWPNADL
jgi:hypothetical protein